MSARPIAFSGVLGTILFAAAAAALMAWPHAPYGPWWSLTGREVLAGIEVAYGAGIVLLLVGDWATLASWLRSGISALGAVLVAAAAVVLLLTDHAVGWRFDGELAIVFAAGLGTMLYAVEGFSGRRVRLEDAQTPIRPLTASLAKRQRAFSIYETFTEGRLEDEVTLEISADASERVKLPLYRSFLEIEFQRDGDGAWTFAFTAFAVTGQANRDTSPASETPARVVDAFEVRWTEGGIAVVTDG